VINLDPTVSRKASWICWLPGLALLRSYQPSWLPHDVIAGMVLTTMLAPVGVAYAVASGVGPIYGLYATVACLLAYAVFGPSRILVLGPDSSLATIIFGVIAPLSAGDPNRAVALAGLMALISGAIWL
jgi:MFS superfamily sulfate permease-like transporter